MHTVDNHISHPLNTQELTLKIFSELNDFKDLCRCARVCKSWNIVASDNTLWKPLFKTTFLLENAEIPAYVDSFKQRFAEYFVREKKWTRELDYNYFKAIDDEAKAYIVRKYGDFLVIHNYVNSSDFANVIEDINSANTESWPSVLFASMEIFNEEKSLLGKGLRKIGEYLFSFEKDTVLVNHANVQAFELKHGGDTCRDDEYIQIEPCLVLLPDSSLLITAASKRVGEDVIESDFYFWDLSTGKCINKVNFNDFSSGPSFFCVHEGCLFIGSVNGLWITNLDGKLIRFLEVDPAVDPGNIYMCARIYSIEVTREGIHALDSYGNIHMWKHKKVTPMERTDNCAQGI